MALLQQKESLDALVNQIQQDNLVKMDVDTYLFSLAKYSQSLARIVHYGQKDKAGKPYIQHPTRVAAKATTLVGYCIRILHDVVEDGKELGITTEWLRDVFQLPSFIANGIDAITRREGESYSQYMLRIKGDYQALKAKIDDMADNADISRFNNPTREHVQRCGQYLEKIWTLKSSDDFQHNYINDLLLDLLAMHAISPLCVMVADQYEDSETIYERWHFGYEGHQNHRYSLIFNCNRVGVNGEVSLIVSAVPTLKIYAGQHIYKPQRRELSFLNMAAARAYIDKFHKSMKWVKMTYYDYDSKHPWMVNNLFDTSAMEKMMRELDLLSV